MADPSPEREHTDASLRQERASADRAVDEMSAAIDATADAVILRARMRADEVLAAARAKTDREASPSQFSASLARERGVEDRLLRAERADADATVRVERAAHAARVSHGRGETDNDLRNERAGSDAALATRDDFLGIVSHDLRNMLNGIVGYASLIQREQHLSPEQVRLHAQRIERSGGRMSRLVGDLVDVASIHAGRLAVTPSVGDLAQVVTEAVETFRPEATARGVALRAELPATLEPVAFDAARILQVLVNLLSNALKFTPSGGSVVARIERRDEDVAFTCADTGVGIAGEDLVAIFERFHQVTKNDRRGTGLGLYISKCIVEGHGGRIWAESAMGAGSTFCFTLPGGTRI